MKNSTHTSKLGWFREVLWHRGKGMDFAPKLGFESQLFTYSCIVLLKIFNLCKIKIMILSQVAVRITVNKHICLVQRMHIHPHMMPLEAQNQEFAQIFTPSIHTSKISSVILMLRNGIYHRVALNTLLYCSQIYVIHVKSQCLK